MILSHDDFLARINERVGESTEDVDLAFLEDMTDTLNDLESRTGKDEVEQLKAENAALRKKYRDRFMNGTNSETDNIETEEAEDGETDLSYDNLWED